MPSRLAVHASCRIGERLEALGGDFPRAVLAHSVAAFGDACARMLRLDRILVEDAMDRVGGGSVRYDLSLVRSPESFTHELPAPSIVLRWRPLVDHHLQPPPEGPRQLLRARGGAHRGRATARLPD